MTPVVLALTYLLEPTPLPTISGSPLRLVPTVDPPLLNVNSSLIDATSNVREGAPPPPSWLSATVIVLFTTYPLPPLLIVILAAPDPLTVILKVAPVPYP